MNTSINQSSVPTLNASSKELLLIRPAYVHYAETFKRDPTPVLPVGLLYAGELLEQKGFHTTYHDSQLYNLEKRVDLDRYSSYGITVMGAQDIVSAHLTYTQLVHKDIDPAFIFLGGQGVEKLSPEEFARIFPRARQMKREELSDASGYWNTSLKKQMEKFSLDDLKSYLANEVPLLFSQGCMYDCTFCGALTGVKETFYATRENLKDYLEYDALFGLKKQDVYATSLDFFQQTLKGGNPALLKDVLRSVIDLKKNFTTTVNARALTRADSYMNATPDTELMSLVKEAGFYQFGFGADGAASVSLLKAMHKGTRDLASKLLSAFAHTEKNGIIPEILYVFGISADTSETLKETKDLCSMLLTQFPTAIYRGFPAKDFIPGNRNWKKESWQHSREHQKLMDDPSLFTNLGFECLANTISHPDIAFRKEVNKYAIEMSYFAHQLGRVQSFLTVPIMETDGYELMDQDSFDLFKEIVMHYAPVIAKDLTLKNMPEHRTQLNAKIPKDK